MKKLTVLFLFLAIVGLGLIYVIFQILGDTTIVDVEEEPAEKIVITYPDDESDIDPVFTSKSNPAKWGEWAEVMLFSEEDQDYRKAYMRVTKTDRKGAKSKDYIEEYNEMVNERNQIPEIQKEGIKYGSMKYEIFFPQSFPEDEDGNIETPLPRFLITSKKGDGIPSGDVVFEVPHIYDISLVDHPENSLENEDEASGGLDSRFEDSKFAPEKYLFVRSQKGEIYKGTVVFPMPKNSDKFLFINTFFDDDVKKEVFFKAYK